MNSEQTAAIERIKNIDPSLKKLIHAEDGNLTIATEDGSNCLGFFEPVHYAANEQMAQIIDNYNEALPLIEALAAENKRLNADYQQALFALALSRKQCHELEDQLNA